MKFLKFQHISNAHKQEILSLWNNEYPVNLNHSDLKSFENYLQNLKDQSHILILNEKQEVKGWYFDFLRENERWFAIILDSTIHGEGYGTKLLNIAKEKEEKLSGWVIDHNKDIKLNGENYRSPLEFYLRNNFVLEAETRLELDTISAVKISWSKK